MNYYNNIKKLLINNEINKRVKNYSINKSNLDSYYNVGKLLFEAGKHYGEGIINKYSNLLINEVDKKYNHTNLKRMRQFYLMIEKGARFGHQLSWSHYRELIPLKDVNKINYYIDLCEKYSITRDELKQRIKSNEYERLPKEAKNKLMTKESVDIVESIPDPVFIRNNKYEVISEKILQKIILEDISSFLKELGEGYSFIDNEYKIKVGNNYNYIDLLLFNINYNCYVVVELKVTELKKEHIGQVQLYMNYIDKNIENINHNKTIGIILVRKNSKFVIEYSSDKRIISREYYFI